MYLYTFFNFGAIRVGRSMPRPGRLPPRKKPDFHGIGGWMGPRAEAVYLYSFFKFGARIGGWSLPRPDRFTSKKETRYPLYCRLEGHKGRRYVPLHFL